VADLTLSLADSVVATFGAPAFVETPGVLVELQGNAAGRAVARRITLLESDTLPVLVFLVTDGENGVYDLSDATVTLRMREREADAGDYKIDAECTHLDDPINPTMPGLVEYRLTADDTDTPGEYYAELIMDFGGSLVYTTEVFVVRIRERL